MESKLFGKDHFGIGKLRIYHIGVINKYHFLIYHFQKNVDTNSIDFKSVCQLHVISIPDI